MRFGFALLLCAFVFNFGFAQEGPDPPVLTGPQIVKNWERGMVVVYTVAKLEDGQELAFSGAGAFRDENGHVATNNHVVKIEDDLVRFFGFRVDPKTGRMILEEIDDPVTNKNAVNVIKVIKIEDDQVRLSGFRVDPQSGQIIFEEKAVKVLEYKYEVVLPSLNRRFSADLIGWSPDVDLALLKISGISKNDYYVGKAGDSDKVKVGETVYVIGSPMRIPNSVTKGIVSKLHWRHGLMAVEDYIQVDAAVNRGNSGGVLLNDRGELIGIINSKNFRAEGIGYAIPVNFLDLSSFLKGGEIKRLVLGVDAALETPPRWGTKTMPRFKDLQYLQSITGLEAENDLETLYSLYRVTWDFGAIVTEIQKDSFAERSKMIKKGDVIIMAGGREVKRGMDLRRALWGWDTAKPFEIEVLRFNGFAASKIKIAVRFGSSAPAPGVQPSVPGNNGPDRQPQQNRPTPKSDKKERNKWS